jgi:hypothetical protein
MIGPLSLVRRALRLRGVLALLCVVPVAGCGGGERLATAETPVAPIDSATPPSDTVPPLPAPDSLIPPVTPPVPGPDPTVPPANPDSIPAGPDPATPPDPTSPPASPPLAPPPEHVGIPFGPYHLPPSSYGPEFSGALRVTHPIYLMSDLEAARRAGARVMLSMVGAERRIRGKDGHYSLEVWKQRLDPYRGFDLSTYIADGTIIGHYIMDEPHDRSNWNGKLVTHAEVDEMAKYSKQIWPAMATIIRGWPDYLKGTQYRYLDAAWAQYSARFGDINVFISNNVRDAKASGLGLVVGLNLLAGGDDSGIKGYYEGRYAMSASQVKRWGGALLDEPHVCAFISWKYNTTYFSRSDIKGALEELSQKARSRPKKVCTK